MAFIRLQLHETDRTRLGCPEWLDVDPASITNREAIAIRNVLGFPTPGLMRDALTPQPVYDDGGNKVVYSNGRPAEQSNELAWTGLVWVALRRAGVETDLATLEFSYEMLGFDVPEPVERVEPSGKAAPSRSRRSARKS